MKISKPSDIITFGKNKGFSLAEIFQYQLSYIEWLILNIEDFKIDIIEFENLPTPTPVTYKPKHFSDEKKVDFTTENIFEILEISDTINLMAGVEDIKDLIKQGFEIEKILNFHFPENVKKINNAK